MILEQNYRERQVKNYRCFYTPNSRACIGYILCTICQQNLNPPFSFTSVSPHQRVGTISFFHERSPLPPSLYVLTHRPVHNRHHLHHLHCRSQVLHLHRRCHRRRRHLHRRHHRYPHSTRTLNRHRRSSRGTEGMVPT